MCKESLVLLDQNGTRFDKSATALIEYKLFYFIHESPS